MAEFPLVRAADPCRRRGRRALFLAALFAVSAVGFGEARTAEARHAIAMHGEPKLPADFKVLPYVNPAAPTGGRLLQGVLGTFDSLNPFVARGLVAQGIRGPFVSNSNIVGGYVIESLMARGFDEPFTLYGLLAETVETDAARSYVTFRLNPAARFSDGKPVTAADVLFSWQLLRDKGRPNHRVYYSKVVKAEAIDERTVRFDLTGNNDRELALILGLISVLPRHATNPDTFEETLFASPVGSGPYRVATVDRGKSVTLVRNPDYWGRDLPINRGFWNFDEIRFDYYRDSNSYQEAFKKGLFDVRTEIDPGRWQTNYDSQALRDGLIVKEAIPNGLPKQTTFFVFNTRRGIFNDVRVREAISLLFDFEWVNRNIFFGLYRRAASYFADSDLTAHGRGADERERAALAPFLDAVRPDVLDGKWSPPASDGSGRDRTALRQALTLLSQAGYELRGTELVERKTGKPLSFEIMVTVRNETLDEERLALLFAGNLKRAGITARVRPVDAVQFEARRLSFDFDMMPVRWDQSLSPGNEQAFYFSSAAADSNGSRNYMGVKSPAVDSMIERLIKAETREDLVASVRALDRILISGFYSIPLFYLPEQWVARWATVHRPDKTSLSGYLPETWWKESK